MQENSIPDFHNRVATNEAPFVPVRFINFANEFDAHDSIRKYATIFCNLIYSSILHCKTCYRTCEGVTSIFKEFDIPCCTNLHICINIGSRIVVTNLAAEFVEPPLPVKYKFPSTKPVTPLCTSK